MGHGQSTRKPKGRNTSPAQQTTQSDESTHSEMDHVTPTDPSPPFSSVEDCHTSSQGEASPTDPLNQDSDYQLLTKFIEEGTSQETSSPLNKVLASSARVLSKFPTNEEAVLMVTGTVLPLCLASLPNDPPSQIMEVQMNALEAFSQLDIQTIPSLIDNAMNLLALMWSCYPSTLPAACNIKQLAGVLNAALQQEEGRSRDAMQYGNLFVTSMMNSLSDSQLVALRSEGVCKNLCCLLRLYEEMDEDTLRHILTGVGVFAELRPNTPELFDEDLYSDLILAAQKHSTHSVLQQTIWRLLTLLCTRSKDFALAIADMEVIPAALTILKQEGSHLTPILKFLAACCQVAESVYFPKCLNDEELMQYLLGIMKSGSTPLENVTNVSDFLALLCSSAPNQCMPRLMELKVVVELEEASRTQPERCILPTYVALDGMVKYLSLQQAAQLPTFLGEFFDHDKSQAMIDEFYAWDHHNFFQHALSNPVVYSNQSLLEVVYLILQRLLKLITPEAIKKMCTREFLELYSISFVRDTISFPSLTNRVIFISHFFVFQIRDKEAVELLREVNLHTPVVDLVSSSSYEVMCTALGLLSCLISKYFEFLKDVNPFLEAQVPALLLDKADKYGRMQKSQFGEDMSRVLLNLTAEKELSLKLYNAGFLEQLLKRLDDNFTPVVKRCIIHAIGNIALAGQNVKEVLYEQNLHMILLSMLSAEAEKGDASQLSACCRVLHILASGDAAKRLFVENNCVEILLKVMRTRKDSPEICWRPLGLLSTLGFMALLNRHRILTKDVMDTVVKILKEDDHGKVLGYTMLVFLAYLQLDDGAVRLRQMAIGDRVREVATNADYQKQSSDLERWGNHVLEKQDLYTVALPPDFVVPPCGLEQSRVSDWPPWHDTEGCKLLPLDVSYFQPHAPLAFELSSAAREQLRHLGLDPDLPLFRVGRVYGSTYGWCNNCDREGSSYEMVIRVQSMTPMQYQHLIDNGWYRRGGVKMFRMMHNHSATCCDWETRVRVKEFDASSHKSYRKVLRKMPMDRLTIETLPRHFSKEAFDLYNRYHISRHDKPQKSEFSYCEHVVDSPIANQTINGVEYGTFHQMYRLDGKLVAIGIVDIVPKGMISIYMWYDVSKEVLKLSFGVYSALKEIECVQERTRTDPQVKYYYLQGWNASNPKLSYKANYQPEELYCPGVVPDWIESTDEVTRAIERVTKEKSTPQQNNMDTTGDSKDSDKEQTDSSSSAANKDATSNQKEADKDKKATSVPCDATEVDRLRHKARTGSTSADISKIIVCLNYTHYMHLGELFERCLIGAHQREMMEKRYEELYLALCPELTSQLVIDLKACCIDGALQVSDSVGVSVDPPTSEWTQSDTGH